MFQTVGHWYGYTITHINTHAHTHTHTPDVHGDVLLPVVQIEREMAVANGVWICCLLCLSEFCFGDTGVVEVSSLNGLLHMVLNSISGVYSLLLHLRPRC